MTAGARWLVLLGALPTAAIAIPALARAATRFGLVSVPGPLNPEPVPVVLTGGMAMLVAGVPGLALFAPGALMPLGLALAVGAVDDRRTLTPAWRVVVWSLIGVLLGITVGPPGLSSIAICVGVTVVLCVGINLLDGIDALAGGVAVAAAAGLAVCSGAATPLALTLAMAAIGFLIWNRPPARCYLGNSGASLVGTWLAAAVVHTLAADPPPARPVVALCVAVPCLEVAITVVRRVRCGELTRRERGHSYDRLVARGWPVGSVSAAFSATQLASAAIGAAFLHRSGLETAAATAVVLAILVTAAHWCGAFG